MQFRTLKLTGFKSFVESAELEISAGLTGIVGPNGCGKSNIVEALRWVMGETSAKRMRGGEMDDVIFSGSLNRPARTIAEVILTVVNDGGAIPALFQSFSELEIRRRIERGNGSDYRINGRPVRARDVQLLFADASIGASSPAMVSQGRISALIAAKPSERRFILEDAAGIGGLQSRRHEAELKLKATEANLAQLDSILDTLRAQESSLKRQARQAQKYRQVSEHIREAEALLLYCDWVSASTKFKNVSRAFDETEIAVRQAMTLVASTAARETGADAKVIAARQENDTAQAALRALHNEQQTLQAETREIESARAGAERDRVQGLADLAHEERERGEAESALSRLNVETSMLMQQRPQLLEAVSQREAEERHCQETVRDMEQEVIATSANYARAEVTLSAPDAADQRCRVAAHDRNATVEPCARGVGSARSNRCRRS